MNEKIQELMEACEVVAEILQKKFHPNTTVIIEVDSVRVEETLASKVIEYEVD